VPSLDCVHARRNKDGSIRITIDGASPSTLYDLPCARTRLTCPARTRSSPARPPSPRLARLVRQRRTQLARHSAGAALEEARGDQRRRRQEQLVDARRQRQVEGARRCPSGERVGFARSSRSSSSAWSSARRRHLVQPLPPSLAVVLTFPSSSSSSLDTVLPPGSIPGSLAMKQYPSPCTLRIEYGLRQAEREGEAREQSSATRRRQTTA